MSLKYQKVRLLVPLSVVIWGLAYDNGRKTITIPPNVVIDPINNVLPWYKPTGPAFYPRF